jgi:hypothetical protein
MLLVMSTAETVIVNFVIGAGAIIALDAVKIVESVAPEIALEGAGVDVAWVLVGCWDVRSINVRASRSTFPLVMTASDNSLAPTYKAITKGKIRANSTAAAARFERANL